MYDSCSVAMWSVMLGSDTLPTMALTEEQARDCTAEHARSVGDRLSEHDVIDEHDCVAAVAAELVPQGSRFGNRTGSCAVVCSRAVASCKNR